MEYNFLYQLLVALVMTVTGSRSMATPRGTCQKVQTSICKRSSHDGYDYTQFPNFVNHSLQTQAIFELNQYKQLIESNCAPELRIFLCSVYIPMCAPGLSFKIPPCRSLCEASKRGCEPLMLRYNFRWPNILKCDKFPSENDGKLCISAPGQKRKPAKKEPKPRADHVKLAQGDSVHLQCQFNQKIYIRKVRHLPHHKRCCPATSKALLANMCNGKNNCAISITQEMFGHDCEQDLRKLSLKFRCVPTSTFIPTKVEVPVCDRKVIYKHRT